MRGFKMDEQMVYLNFEMEKLRSHKSHTFNTLWHASEKLKIKMRKKHFRIGTGEPWVELHF